MKESHGRGPASHSGPESCGVDRKVAAEALTGENADQVLGCEIKQSGVPTPLSHAEGNTEGSVKGELPTGPAQSETLCMRGHSLHGNREIPQAPAEAPSVRRSWHDGLAGEGYKPHDQHACPARTLVGSRTDS